MNVLHWWKIAPLENNLLYYMWPDLRKPNIIAQHRFFSIKHWNTLGKYCVFWKKSVHFFTRSRLVLDEGRGQRLKPGYHCICPSKKSSKIFVWLQCTQGIVSYKLFLLLSCITTNKVEIHEETSIANDRFNVTWTNGHPVIHSSVHGEHDGAKFESLPHSIYKLHPF